MRQTRPPGSLGVIFLVSTVLASGCGGKSGARLSKAEYAARANAICAAFGKTAMEATSRMERTIKGAPNPTVLMKKSVEMDSKLLPLFHDMFARLKELKPPAPEQQTADKAVALGEKLTSEVAEMVAAVRGNDIAAAWKIDFESAPISEKLDPMFVTLGATKCTSSANSSE